MGKKAFLFPGQGAQYVGMAADLWEKSAEAREKIMAAEEAMDVKISEIMFNGPVEALKQTDITQPAIFLHSVLLAGMINKIKPDMAAGHSLGEYSALVAAGALNFCDAVKLVRFRGEKMLQAGIDNPGTMAAVIGMAPGKMVEVCEKASVDGIVQCANFNSPGQIVISGSITGVESAMKIAKESGAKIVKKLIVSGAFHSPLMQSAKDKLKKRLEETEFSDASFDVYANVTAKPVRKKEEIKELLFQQVTAPVRWEETIKNMIEAGADEFYEIGPGNVLRGLVKRIDSSVKLFGISKFEEVEQYT